MRLLTFLSLWLWLWFSVPPFSRTGYQFSLVGAAGEVIQEFEISEDVPVGTRIGFVRAQSPSSSTSFSSSSSSPSYLIVPVPGSSVETDLSIDQTNGEIRTKIQLDRESRDLYSFIAIPVSGGGENVRVVIKVGDVNDNAPEFPSDVQIVEFPENTPRDVKRTLSPARDSDLGIYNTQRYVISDGNVNNAFRLSSHRERDEILYLDLVVNGFLDRETNPSYSLLIEAYDGGNPPRKSSMRVQVTIQDVNDNSPSWSQSRYFATVPENSSVGTKVLQVFATDTDEGRNGEVSYSINRRQSDRDHTFAIDKKSGVISTARPLRAGAAAATQEAHELVVVGRDNGAQPLETTVFVSIRVLNVRTHSPQPRISISLVFLTSDGTPKVSEGAAQGEYVARVNVLDPDSKEAPHAPQTHNVTLQGGGGHFELLTRNGVVYIVTSSKRLDREEHASHKLTITVSAANVSTSFEVQIMDVNDNEPVFTAPEYYATVLETAPPGSSVLQVTASDADAVGNNSLVTYELLTTPDSHSEWFQIESSTGLITTSTFGGIIDCEIDPMPRLVIVARDHGTPALSSTVMVHVAVINVQNEPIFDQSFYNVSVPENTVIGKCILKVDALDPDCGARALINYTLSASIAPKVPISVNRTTGEVCISGKLDYEQRSSYELPIVATDTGGLSSTTMVKIHVTDLNDNSPRFSTQKYNLNLREGVPPPKGPLVTVVATDPDSGAFGQISYEIAAGNDEGKFRIDKSNGELFLLRSLPKSRKRGDVTLSIAAIDGGGRRSESPAEIMITVIDSKQAQPPVFQKSHYKFAIDEDTPIGSVIGSVALIAASGGKVRYSISSGDPGSYFVISANLGEIKTTKLLDHETHSAVLLNIQATTTNDPQAQGHCQVEITIRDVNDESPTFDISPVTVWIPENTKVGSLIYGVHAKDRDSGQNGRVKYSFGKESHFKLDSHTGHLTLASPLDYETTKKHTLTIGAQDSGSPPRFARPNLTLIIEIQDVNDCEPVFEQQNYLITVSEGAPLNSTVIELKAVDADSGNNGRVSYTFASPSQEMFGIISSTGTIFLRESLDRELKDSYSVRVVATDHGSVPLSSTALVTIRVTDENDNRPEFTKKYYQFSMDENVEPWVVVGTVVAHDKDEGKNAVVRYYLHPTHADFQIDPNTGVITATSLLDAGKQSRYELQVIAVDQGADPKQSEVIVQIQVLPRRNRSGSSSPSSSSPSHPHGSRADSPASKYKFQFKIYENATVGHLVGVVTYSGAGDENSVGVDYDDVPRIVSYAIIGGNTDDSFEINRATGELFVAQPLDYETNSRYVLQIRTSTGMDNDDSQMRVITADVDLLDVNDERPRFVTDGDEDPITISVPETTRVGSAIWNFTALDLDSGINGLVHYAIVKQSGEDSAEKFRINTLSGVLYLNSELDHEQQSSYIIIVSASDQAQNVGDRLQSTLTVQILVQDANDNFPVFNSSTRAQIWETEPLHSVVHIVRAVDADTAENERLVYRITNGNQDGFFALNETNGQLKLVNSLRTDIGRMHQQFILNISASDHGTPPKSAHQILEVTIQELVTSRPQFVQKKYEARVQENSLIGSEILRVSANRRNQSTSSTAKMGPGRLVYKIPDGIADAKFSIHATSGSVTVAGLIDRELQSEYLLTVYVHDDDENQSHTHMGAYDSAELLIKIIDVNDEAPHFRDTCIDLRVPENRELGLVHTFKAWDSDAGRNGEVTYSIVSGNADNMFNIEFNTGKFTSRPLDREQKSSYQLLVAAQDQGHPMQRTVCNFTVFVEDENDNTPTFLSKNQYNRPAEYAATIPENVPVGTTVLVVEANDADIGINAVISYSLHNESYGHFTIDNSSGVITTTGLLDRERVAQYSFEVVATDSGVYDSRSSKAKVKVILTDVNTQPPRFSQNTFTVEVSPHTKAGQRILQVMATDSDEGVNRIVTYSITNRETRFRIQPQTGIISPAVSLVAENGKMIHITVIATDGGSPPLSASALVVVQVGEIPLANSLQFQHPFYEGSVPENSVPGTKVVQVTALKKNGRLHRTSYSIVVGNEDGAFEMVSESGQIRVGNKVGLNRERKGVYSLVVVAKTETATPLFAATVVNVTLLDENDNAAVFNQNTYSASVWEGNNKGTFVTQVTARDADGEGQNSNLIYHIVDGNHDNSFIIDPPFSGIVKTNIVLDREIQDEYRLTIIATDEGTPQMSGTCVLYIKVIDVNDNSPAFAPTSVFNIMENLPVGSLVTTAVANDVDTNPVLEYSFVEGGNPNGTFFIGKYTGRITLASPLDYEDRTSHVVQIQVSDSVHYATNTLQFNVLDFNDHSPTFEKAIYHVALADDIKPGSQIFQVNATDKDSQQNGRVKYSLQRNALRNGRTRSSFWFDENTGSIYTNESLVGQTSVSELTVVATDLGRPPRQSRTTLWIEVSSSHAESVQFTNEKFMAEIDAGTRPGTVITEVTIDNSRQTPAAKLHYHFAIKEGDPGGYFSIGSHSGVISLIKPFEIDQETATENAKVFHLTVSVDCIAEPKCSSSTQVVIRVVNQNDDHIQFKPLVQLQDGPQPFNETLHRISVSETKPIGSPLFQLESTDPDFKKSNLQFDITSGNDDHKFGINSNTGVVTLKQPLDYDHVSSYRLVLRARSAISTRVRRGGRLIIVHVDIEDENEHAPLFILHGQSQSQFPHPQYLETVAENEPPGTTVFTARAIDLDKGIYGRFNYSLVEPDVRDKFQIHTNTGLVSTRMSFDYETKNRYYFSVRATDFGGLSSTIRVQVDIESRDEFVPQFTQKMYKFVVPSNAGPGYVIGFVEATDLDQGVDGRVLYQLHQPNAYIRVNRTTGALIMKTLVDGSLNGTFLIIANSGRPSSKSTRAFAELSIGEYSAELESLMKPSLISWIIGLIIAALILILTCSAVFVVLHIRKRKNDKSNGYTGKGDKFNAGFDTLEYAHAPQRALSGSSSLYCPQYTDLATMAASAKQRDRANTTVGSEDSDQSHSGSSGRGSAEDGEEIEDEEIRMITEGGLAHQIDGLHAHGEDGDNTSQSQNPATNTQEYLARLGIVSKPKNEANIYRQQQQPYSNSGVNDMLDSCEIGRSRLGSTDNLDLSTLIYSQIPEDHNSITNSTLRDGTSILKNSHHPHPHAHSSVSVTGSLSSVIHSEEEVTGSYNWDYLLDWGPQYQPLAQVFSEIARLKDDAHTHTHGSNIKSEGHYSGLIGQSHGHGRRSSPGSQSSGRSGRSQQLLRPGGVRTSNTKFNINPRPGPLPPVPMPAPRSPISHDSTFASGLTSPSFEPTLSPFLANASPNMSPIVIVGPSSIRTSQLQQHFTSDSEAHI